MNAQLFPGPVESPACSEFLRYDGHGYHAQQDAADEEIVKVLLEDVEHLGRHHARVEQVYDTQRRTITIY